MQFLQKTRLKIRRVGMVAALRQLKHEEQRLSVDNPMRAALHKLRHKEQRPGVRAANLAYGFLSGRRLRQVELNARSRPQWELVQEFILDYTDYSKVADIITVRQRLEEWITAASLLPAVAPSSPALNPLPLAEAEACQTC